MRTRTATVVGGLLVTVAIADATAAIVLAREKSFLGVGGVRSISIGLATVVALAGGATVWRARVPPRRGARPGALGQASLALGALVCLSLPASLTHLGTGRFCTIGGGFVWLALLSPFVLLVALGLLVRALARRGDLAAAGVGVLLAALPSMAFLLARLADRITCGD